MAFVVWALEMPQTGSAKYPSEYINQKEREMRNKNLPSRLSKHLRRNTTSNESYNRFAAVVGVWWRCAGRRKASGR